VTVNGGDAWMKMNNNMPNVPVHDLLVHPRENDLVVGSYGRGIFITNIAPLQQLTDAILEADVHLFQIKPTVQRVIRAFAANDYLFGQRNTQTPNEPNGMVIRYYLKADAASAPSITIADAGGQQVATLTGTSKAGINTVVWTTRDRGDEGRSGGGRGAGAGRGGGGGRGSNAPGADPLAQWAPLGEYTVALEVGGKKLTQKALITKTQGWSIGAVPTVIREGKPKS
jgi:hypothetical protein